jgi:hypothetical protein
MDWWTMEVGAGGARGRDGGTTRAERRERARAMWARAERCRGLPRPHAPRWPADEGGRRRGRYIHLE